MTNANTKAHFHFSANGASMKAGYSVYKDGNWTGMIKKMDGFWRFVPKGCQYGGLPYDTAELVQDALTGKADTPHKFGKVA